MPARLGRPAAGSARQSWAIASRRPTRSASTTATASRGTRRRCPTRSRFPETTDEVAAIVAACARARVPVVPFGMGSSLEGHVNAVRGGISIDLTRMTRVVRLSADDLDVTVEAGLTHRQAERSPQEHRPDVPGRSRRRRDARRHDGDARVGHDRRALRHDARERARADGGPGRWARHPHRRPRAQVVVRLRPDAAVRRLRRHARRHHRGHAAAVRPARSGDVGRVPVPDAWRARRTTVITTIQLGIPVARIEIIDEQQLDARQPLLEDAAIRWRRRCSSSSTAPARRRWPSRRARSRRSPRENGALGVPLGVDARRTRHALAGAPQRRCTPRWRRGPAPGRGPRMSACRSRALAECILETQDDLRRANIVAPLVGHAGDGNFHLIFMVNADDAAEMARGEGGQRAAGRARAAPRRHLHRRARRRLRQAAVSGARNTASRSTTMRAIKRALDPHNLMNPGKLIPD